jgi:CRISPR-associated protein Csm1
MASYENIVLAAWLHDISTFVQRDGIEGSPEEILKKIKEYLPKDVQAEVIRLASACHNPVSYDEWIIAHGSRLSGGVDKNNEMQFNEQALVNIVSTLHIEEKKAPDKAYCLLKPMEDDAIFASANAKAGKQEYQELWQDFENDFRSLQRLKYHDFMLSLDTLMERYCWCVPSTTRKGEDVSLYQHSKLTAAFAGTLYLYHNDKKTETETALNQNDDTAFLFVQGDVSGIQKYIFDLKTTKDNAKLLRARSFQIWTLAVIIAEYLVGQFGVSRENIITSAGGKFLLLLPNTQAVIKKLPELRFELEEYCLREFAGKLTFVLSDGIPASGSELQNNLQKLLNTIGTNGEKAKQKKMQAVLGQCGPVLTDHYDRLQRNGECEWCETLPANSEFEGKKICTNCADLINIGGELMRTSKIILKTGELTCFKDMVILRQKDDNQFGYLTEYKIGFPLMALPYVAPIKDEKRNELYTFEEIADEKSTGNKKLAMFKADIDNLGLIFTSSWGTGTENRISFPHYAQLSRHLHYFFSGYVSGFIKNHSEYRDTIYTVFSGGDDLCVLGAWDAVMRFAADFNKEFSKFANNNPSVTLSGGIALADPHLPVRAIAAAAEEALEEAKGRKENEKTVKNGVSVFGVTVSWDEYEKSLKDGETIKEYMDSKIVSSTLVYKMIDFANRAQNVKNGSQRERDLLWMSNYRYVIVRNIDAKQEDESKKEEAKKALKFFHEFGVCPEAMVKSRIAVSYALYSQRNNSGNKEADNG